MESQFGSSYDLEKDGIKNTGFVYWNLSTPVLLEEAIRRREGRMAHLGVLVIHRRAYRALPQRQVCGQTGIPTPREFG